MSYADKVVGGAPGWTDTNTGSVRGSKGKVKRDDRRPRSRERSESKSSSRSNSRPSSRSRSSLNSQDKGGQRVIQQQICWHFEGMGKCPYGDKCRFKHPARVNKQPGGDKKRTKQPGWKVVSNKKKKKKGKSSPEHFEVLKVHSKASLHPGRWRNELKRVDPKTFELTSWISREGEWLVLHANAEDVDALLARLRDLRQLQWTVEVLSEEYDDDGDREGDGQGGVCANFMAGRSCTHSSPCK